MLNCPSCGVTNRPYETDCVLCERPIQEASVAAAKRREWDALPAPLREEQEKAFDRMREGMVDHRDWLRRNRKTHAVVGAVLFSFFMNFGYFFNRPVPMLVDLAIGAVAALLLNYLKGGTWRGTGVFLSAAIVSVIARLPLINVEAWLMGPWLMACFAVLVVTGIGYLMGMKLDFDHTDHNVTP